MKGSGSDCTDVGKVITVVGEGLSGCEDGSFAHDLVALHYGRGVVVVFKDPFATENGYGSVGEVVNAQEVNECVGECTGQVHVLAVVNEFVQHYAKAL